MKRFHPGLLPGAFGSLALVVLSAAAGFTADPPKAEAKSTETPAKPTAEQIAFFESKIRPVLANNCFTCHADAQQRGGLRLDSREAVLKGGAKGLEITPGDPEKSRLINAVRYEGALKMPPMGKLRPEEVDALTAWVKMGAPWPDAKPVSGGNGQAADMNITAAQKEFWSFRPVKKPTLPTVKNAAWCRNPIDRFILAKLESKGLKPAPAGDRPSLIRRVTFDLIGLPPTPEEVAAYVNDKSPNAWGKVVDRLLANPHYGERWGRHWLDIVRYADSNGLDENVAFANAWRYRDYVVGAFNQDKPYNQFIQEQLAGDLMPADNESLHNDRITATGFLSLGPKLLAEPDKPKMVMDIVDEQIEVTSKAFLGLTVTCARCHNHKFDPIPTKDYYALAGIFKSTKTMQSLNTVAMWQERPLQSKKSEAELAAAQQQIQAAEAKLQQARTKANDALLSELRNDADKYLQAAWELKEQGEPVSVAGTPANLGDSQRIEVEATEFRRGNLAKDRDNYGRGKIGVIFNVGLPDEAEYEINVPAAGNYQIEMRYASAENRPVHLLLNGKLIKEDAAGQVTGGFFEESQAWEVEGVYAFKQGKNVFRIECNDHPIPHFNKILFASVKPRPNGLPIRSAEQIASQYRVNPALLRHVVRFVGGVQTDPTKMSPADREAAVKTLVQKITLPDKPEQFYADNIRKQVARSEKTVSDLKANETKPPMVMAVEDTKAEDCRVHIRGDTQNLGDSVPRHFLTVLGGDKIVVTDEKRSGRLELAQWIARPEHPLTSRVEVNRIWQGHFGTGIVQTPDNWGFLGARPTNPELLDWLAATFVEQGWSVKKMHRLILLSNTYKMGTVADSKTEQIASKSDPDNTLLWKIPRRRLEAEPFRDSLLFVSGKLDLTMGGSLMMTKDHDYVTNDQSGNAANYNAPRRSLYLPIIRNALFDMFLAFDYGDPSMVNAKRATTTVAPQALYVMNSPFVMEQSKNFAAELLANVQMSDAERLKLAYQKAYARVPLSEETARALSYLNSYASRLPAAITDPAKRREEAWDSLCQLIFASNEFIYLN